MPRGSVRCARRPPGRGDTRPRETTSLLRGRLLPRRVQSREEVRTGHQAPAPHGMFNARGSWRPRSRVHGVWSPAPRWSWLRGRRHMGVDPVGGQNGGRWRSRVDGRPVPPHDRGADLTSGRPHLVLGPSPHGFPQWPAGFERGPFSCAFLPRQREYTFSSLLRKSNDP